MAHANMSAPLTTQEEHGQAVSAEVGSVALDPFREFDFDLATNRLHVVGYSPAEVETLLALYRDHLRLMSEMAAEQHRALQEAGA